MALILFCVLVIALFLISIYLLQALNNYFLEQKGMELMTRANIIANASLEHNNLSNIDISDFTLNDEIRVVITDKEINVLYDSAEIGNLKGKVFLREEVNKALEGVDEFQYYIDSETGLVINAAVPIIKEGDILGVVFLTDTAQDTFFLMEDIKKTIYTIIIIVSIFIGIISLIIAGFFTRRIGQIADKLENMSIGEPGQEIIISGNDEIAQLADKFNDMNKKIIVYEEKRQKFVSDASHELRTPLSSIKILTQTLINMKEYNKSIFSEFLKDIDNEIERLSNITKDLLNLTRIDAKEMNEEIEDVILFEVINDVVKKLKPLAEGKNITINIDKSEIDIKIKVYKVKLIEAVFNIIDNAIKYTLPNGRIRIGITKSINQISIYIADSGIGIPKDEIDRVFERFYRVDKARARGTGGTGLGLSIAQSAIKACGGEILLQSKEGIGSIFKIVFPIKN